MIELDDIWIKETANSIKYHWIQTLGKRCGRHQAQLCLWTCPANSSTCRVARHHQMLPSWWWLCLDPILSLLCSQSYFQPASHMMTNDCEIFYCVASFLLLAFIKNTFYGIDDYLHQTLFMIKSFLCEFYFYNNRDKKLSSFLKSIKNTQKKCW